MIKKIKKQKEPIMKSIVETTGPFGLLNGKEVVAYDRPSVVTNCQFIDQRIYRREIRVLAYNLPDKADDNEFLKVLVESKDPKLAIAAYCALFGQNPDGTRIEGEVESEEQKQIRLADEAKETQRLADEKKIADDAAEQKRIKDEADAQAVIDAAASAKAAQDEIDLAEKLKQEEIDAAASTAATEEANKSSEEEDKE